MIDQAVANPPRFISEAITPGGDYAAAPAFGREPPVPQRFVWRDESLVTSEVVRAWRSTNVDRGDVYLSRHWYELRLADGRLAVVYYDRKARGTQRWWLYTLREP